MINQANIESLILALRNFAQLQREKQGNPYAARLCDDAADMIKELAEKPIG